MGIFARCFPVQSPSELASTIAAHGFSLAQLNLSAIGKATIPAEDALADLDLTSIGAAFRDARVGVWGLSGSYNMIDPDASRAAALTADLARLIRRAPELGARAVTLCTGTRDAQNMWRAHPDNGTEAAWADLLANLRPLLDAAEEAELLLAVEPEPGNVISGTNAAVRLLEELGDRASRIGFILDPANLVADSAPGDREQVLRDAFARLGANAICMHAKDVVSWDDRVSGADGLDFDLVRALHAHLPHPVPVIIQDAGVANMRAVKALVEGTE
jgi:sugar phosphate isomerase/epimerase